MLRIEGYVIVSANGMLADANRVMPKTLKFKGDLEFFTAGLDRADVVVHGRNSFEDQPNSPLRKRIVLTHRVTSLAGDPDNAKATLWNPAGASFEDACVHAGVRDGTAAIIGGPSVFEMFLDRYDIFWLSEAPHVTLPGGEGCFPGVPEDSPQAVLAAHGLEPREIRILDPTNDIRVTAWRPAR